MASRILREQKEFWWKIPRLLTAADVGHGSIGMVSYCVILKLSQLDFGKAKAANVHGVA